MMFAQANSEHCRHKIFNARWVIDGEEQASSLFQMIRSTHAANPAGVLSAYRDNAAVIEGAVTAHLFADPVSGAYRSQVLPVHTLMKVETHNHPTAISPFPGAATGSGGELRDEGATGRGGRPKAGLTGFSVSNLAVPGWPQPWEYSPGRPERIASPLQIMLEGPIGAASFNNEFGRPNIAGYFRTFEQPDATGSASARGYHKPIMIAGGLGNISGADVEKAEVPVGALLIVLGGPAMLIGLGGGAASSVGSGTSAADLDFASVQRGNPEIERRAQQVIEACRARAALDGVANPMIMLHDVGAGGLSNAVPELVDHSHRGATIELREIPNAEPGMSPLEIWCNEAQERYVLAIEPADLDWFAAVCARERCPYAVLGSLDDSGRLIVTDRELGGRPVDMPLETLLGKAPQMLRRIERRPTPALPLDLGGIDLAEACQRVLRMPVVADKSFLINIGDRTVGGLVARDQFVGPWQVPVSDVAVTALGFETFAGEAMAMGERAPVALARRAGLRSSRGRRGADQYRCGIDCRSGNRAAVGQLDGGSRQPGRGRASLRHGRCGQRAVPGTEDRDPGRQGFAVDADALDRGGRQSRGGGAGLAGRVGFRAGRRCAPHADAAARAGRRHPACCSSIWAGAATAWVLRCWRRPSIAAADVRPISMMPAPAWLRCLPACRRSAPGNCCSPITIAAMAACSSRCARWLLPAGPGSISSCGPVAGDALLGALFAEEAGAVLQVRDTDLAAVQAILAAAWPG